MEFMRKYIHIAKSIKPVLTREAADCIADEYSKLRSQEATANNVARVSTDTDQMQSVNLRCLPLSQLQNTETDNRYNYVVTIILNGNMQF